MGEFNRGTGDGADEQAAFSRRTWLKLAGAGVTMPASLATNASAASSFVDLLSVDPSEYPNVSLNVSVDTAAGRNGELTKDDFTVVENGVEREITDFSFGSPKSDVVFVFDDTGSMSDEINGVKSKVTDLISDIEAAGIDARYGLVSFKDDIEVDLELVDDADRLRTAVDDLSASGGGDSPEDNFDAIVRALGLDFRSDAQKVIIDITDALSHYDGDGTGFSEYTIDEVASRLTDSGVAYIAVSPGYADERASKRELAERVDGTYIDINDGDFTMILEEIIGLIVTAYVVEYVTGVFAGATAPVSLIVDDPEEGTGRVEGEVDVPEDVGPNLSELYGDKRDRIASIRDTARPVLSADPAGGFPSVTLFGPEDLDRGAEQYLDGLDPDGDGEPEVDENDREQTAEALERLVNIEAVTENAVGAPVRDTGSGPLVERQVEAAFDVFKTLAFEAITRGAGKAASRGVQRAVNDDVIQGVLDEVGSIKRSLSVTGHGGAGAHGRGLSQSADDQRLTFDELDERYRDETLDRRDAQKEFVEGGVSSVVGGSLDPAADFFGELDDIAAGTEDVLVQLEYQKYLHGSTTGRVVDVLDGLAEFDPPTLDLSDVPDTVEVPTPGSGLANDTVDAAEGATNGFSKFIDDQTDKLDNVDELEGVDYEHTSDVEVGDIPDEITVDLLEELPEEIDFGEVPGVETIQELADLAAELAAIPEPAIDPSIDQLVERIAEDAGNGALSQQSQADREEVLNVASSVIESVVDTTDFALNKLKELSGLIDLAETALGILTVVAAVIGLASTGGVGSIPAIAILGALSTLVVGISVVVDSLRYLVAQKGREAVGGTHSAAGGLITYTDLSLLGGGS